MAFKISKTPNWYKKLLSTDIDSAISGLTANDSTKLIFSTMTPNGNCCAGDSSTDPVNPVFIRSTTCWAKNIDTSPISPWNNGGGYSAPLNAGGFGGVGTLVSPRHIVLTNHFYVKTGKKFIFVAMDNTCYVRTLTTTARVGSILRQTDIIIGLLDSDLPSNVSFCQVASFNLASKPSGTNKFPMFMSNLAKKAIIADGYSLTGVIQSYSASAETQKASFFESAALGTSANPMCFVYNNKLILLSLVQGSSSGDLISNYINECNSVMSSLGGGYQLSVFDLKPTPTQNKCLIKKNSIGGGKIKTTSLSDSYPGLIRLETMGFDIFGITTANTNAQTASFINSGEACNRTFILTTIGQTSFILFGQVIFGTGPVLGSLNDLLNTYYGGVYDETKPSTLRYSNGLWTLSIVSTVFVSVPGSFLPQKPAYQFTAVGTRFKIPTNYTQGVYIAANPTAHIECNPYG
jgi:hypothetical protein